MIAADFERLRHELDLCLAEVLELACTGATTTAARWRMVVDHTAPPLGGAADRAQVPVVEHTAPPLGGAADRAQVPVVDHTAPPLGGALPPAGVAANPAEVRAVLLAVHARYVRRLHALEVAFRDAPPAERAEQLADAMWTFRHRRLDQFVADELAAYVQRVTPVRSVAAVFARAASAPAPAPVAIASTAALVRCVTCAAPRLATALYGNCIYCGHPLFTGRAEVE